MAASINATCLALTDAGVSMKNILVACSCAIQTTENQDNGSALVDQVASEESTARSTYTLVFNSSLKDIVAIKTRGSFTQQELWHITDVCRNQSQNLLSAFRTVIQTKYQVSQ